MHHGPAARRRATAAAPRGSSAPRAEVDETLEDRVGARAARRSPEATPRDPWLEMAEIVVRLLQPGAGTSDAAGTPVPSPAPVLPARPTAPVAAGGPGTTGAPPPLAEPAPAEAPAPAPPPHSPEGRLLAGETAQPPTPEVEVPAFPSAVEGPDLAAPAAAPEAAAPAAPAAPAAAPVPQPATDEAPGPGSHRRIVARWAGGVAAGGAALPRTTVRVRPDDAAALDGRVGEVRTRHAGAREGVADEALSNVPPAPQVEAPPTPPPGNPVPEHTSRIVELSNRRLPDENPPALVRSDVRALPDLSTPVAAGETAPPGASVGGNLPTLGDEPVAPDLFQVLTTPGARDLAALPEGGAPGSPAAAEARRVEDALAMLTRTAEPEGRSEPGERVISLDRGPVPAPALPSALQAPVGQVVARLLAQAGEATTEGLNTLRRRAYAGGVLLREFPDIGSVLSQELGTLMDTELREIAAAANVSAEQLAGMVSERQRELNASAADASAEAASEGQAAADAVADEGQRTMDAIEGAADQAEEETLRRQEAASGGADPVVIRARRDRTVAWIREHVTTQTTNYQQAGERRSRELTQVRTSQTNAYRALVQREQYQVLTPQPPLRPARDPNDRVRESRLADLVNLLRVWGDERVTAVTEAIRLKLAATTERTRSHRSQIEAAGSAGIEAARVWAEDRELEGQSWWTRMLTRIRRWLSESNQLTEQWHVRRTTENRNAVANDLVLIDAARARLAEGVTQDELLADEALTEQQRELLEQFFAAGPDANPLDIAANRLRDNVAMGHLERARQVFEDELVATPVGEGDFDTVEKLNQVARAGGGGFDAAHIAQELHAAMDQMGTDEARIYASLRGLSRLRGAVVRKQYYAMFGSSLDDDFESELSGDELARAQAGIEGQTARADAIALHDAIAGWGTDEAAIMGLLRNKTPAEVEAIRAEYLSMYGQTLQAALEADLEEGNEIDQANALMSGDTATADAIAIDDAMRGGLTGWGTGEAEVEAVYTRVRSEVLALAEAQSWTSAQMEAEVRRRLAAIEERFGRRYANVEQYNAPGLEGETVLARAYRSELSGADLDLANALQRNDLVAADAARIEIERTGFYSSDERLRGVLRSQYERALEARRLDEGPARHMRVTRLVDELRRQRDPVLSEEEISRRRMALERQMERELEDGAQEDSNVSMEALRSTYEGRYNRISLAYDMETMTSGSDRLAARAMLRQGGRLTPLQEVDYATRGDGTDEEALRRTLSRMTWAEIQVLRADWEHDHPGRSFDSMLRGELSGRDESDIMDMVVHGAPESAMERIDTERRRVDRELRDLTGVLGETAAGREAAWMRHQRDRLGALEAPLARTDWPDTEAARREREALAADVDFRVNRVREAVEDHRRRLDSFTDAVTQVVGIAVGLTVAVLLGAISGGTLGVATIAVMASLMATASTMISKQLILGGAYGDEDIMTDVAVGVVDALTAAATAGMGSRLLRPVQNLVARTRVGDVVGWMGRSGLAQRVTRAPGVGSVAQRAGRAVGGRAGLERAAAAFLAEGAEDVVGAVPSSFTQLALSDQTWRGDPLMNFLEGGGMAVLQSLAMGRMLAGGMSAGGSLFRAGRGHLRMGSDVGRLLEANRLITEGFQTHLHDNPGASLVDFMSHPDGRRLRAEIDRRGLLPTLEGVTARAREAGAAPPRAVDPNAPVRPEAEATAARADELSQGLPGSLREGTTVTPDAALAGNTVRVEPRWEGGRIVGVEVRAGPGATALDIALHAATVNAMQSYRGVLGNVRRALENAAALLTRSGLSVGSRGWEARLELGKLPAIIASRMEGLAGRVVTPELEVRLRADLDHLQAQLSEHQRVLADPALRRQPGRGHVAAEGSDAFARAPRRDESGALTEVGEVELQIALRDLRAARRAQDGPAMRQALEAIEALTDVPPNAALKILRLGQGGRGEVRSLLEGIRNADPQTDGPYIADLMAQVRGLTGLDADTVLRVSTQPESAPGAARLLGVPVIREGPAPPRATGSPRMPAESGDARLQRLMGELQPRPDPDLPARGAVEVPPADVLIARIATGDADAQAMLNRNSAAPPHYEVENFNMARMMGCMTTTSRGRQRGVLRIGNGTIEISRARPTKKNPNPPFHFHGEFPPFELVGNRVLQLEDGALRVWRAPDGTLMQETTVSGRRERAGHETRLLESFGKSGMTGPRTERAHAHGAGRSPESPFGILHAPVDVNQVLQKRGIEGYLEALRDNSPPGVSWHYATEVTPQTDGRRLSTVTYRIDVTIRGQRVPFAEFSIRIDPLPAVNRRGRALRGNDISWVSPIRFRDSEHPTVQSILGMLRELADVPGVLHHGLPRGAAVSAARAVQQLATLDTDGVRRAVQHSEGRLRALPPGDAAHFDAAAWARQLSDHFDSGSWARFVVVDLRGLGLNAAQIAAVDAAIAALPRRNARRVLVLR